VQLSLDLGVLFAGVYYLYQITDFSLFEVINLIVMYINVNVMFLLFLRRKNEKEK